MFERLIRGSLGPYAVFSRIRGEFFPKDPPAEFFPDASWQRCVVHFYRNVFSHVPSPKMREVAAMLKAIHASEDIAAAREKALRVVAKLRDLRLTKAAELVEMGVAETLAYYEFPEAHWRRIRTNNPLERILREDPPAIARGRPVPRRAIGVEPCRGAATLHRRQRMVDQEVPAHGAAEGPAD